MHLVQTQFSFSLQRARKDIKSHVYVNRFFSWTTILWMEWSCWRSGSRHLLPQTGSSLRQQAQGDWGSPSLLAWLLWLPLRKSASTRGGVINFGAWQALFERKHVLVPFLLTLAVVWEWYTHFHAFAKRQPRALEIELLISCHMLRKHV